MIVYDIFRIFLHFILSILRYIIINFYNFFTFNVVVKCLGRVPVSESSVAFRISGPGVGKMNFFYNLNHEDIHLLVRAKMEEIVLNNYRKYVIEKIKAPIEEA